MSMKQALIYFGLELSPESFDDDEARHQALERGWDVVGGVKGIKLVRRLPSACAVVAQGSDATLKAVCELLDRRNLGHLELDQPGALRAAE